ncbi:GTPase Era [Patescibacteria group bacterium]|nr:GTPase Era [Patescibacteria group bacterium]
MLKSGIATLVGRSNVGKSTLLNTLVGTKIAAVTHRPQTTRNIIHGVMNTAQGQAVFVDTPGIFKEKSALAGTLSQRVHEAIKDIDLVVYVVDPGRSLGAEERSILAMIRRLDVPKILVINKSDLPKDEKEFLDDYKNLSEEFLDTFEVSALRNRHVQPLRDRVIELLPEGEPYYPENQKTNIDPKFWVAEIVREKIFLALRKEVPYTTHVEVSGMEEKPDVFVVKANIFTSESKYKKMIIGARGRALKEIGIAARKELEAALNKKIFLELEVEVDKHWTERV